MILMFIVAVDGYLFNNIVGPIKTHVQVSVQAHEH